MTAPLFQGMASFEDLSISGPGEFDLVFHLWHNTSASAPSTGGGTASHAAPSHSAGSDAPAPPFMVLDRWASAGSTPPVSGSLLTSRDLSAWVAVCSQDMARASRLLRQAAPVSSPLQGLQNGRRTETGAGTGAGEEREREGEEDEDEGEDEPDTHAEYGTSLPSVAPAELHVHVAGDQGAGGGAGGSDTVFNFTGSHEFRVPDNAPRHACLRVLTHAMCGIPHDDSVSGRAQPTFMFRAVLSHTTMTTLLTVGVLVFLITLFRSTTSSLFHGRSLPCHMVVLTRSPWARLAWSLDGAATCGFVPIGAWRGHCHTKFPWQRIVRFASGVPLFLQLLTHSYWWWWWWWCWWCCFGCLVSWLLVCWVRSCVGRAWSGRGCVEVSNPTSILRQVWWCAGSSAGDRRALQTVVAHVAVLWRCYGMAGLWSGTPIDGLTNPWRCNRKPHGCLRWWRRPTQIYNSCDRARRQAL